MAVLTNFLPLQELTKQEVTLEKGYITQFKRFRKAVDQISETFDYQIDRDSSIGRHILTCEAEVYQDCWYEVGEIPKGFGVSCLNTKEPYTRLSDLSQYPVVKVEALKKIADVLGFVILPIDYVNMGRIVEMYEAEDEYYADLIRVSYEKFKETVSSCETITGRQQLYMLAPISFYDPWEEVSCDVLLPKFFSHQLSDLATTLGMIIPTQRNLYKLIKANERNLSAMQANINEVEKAIENCHKRIDWVISLTEGIERKVNRTAARTNRMELNLYNMQLRVSDLEYKLYCLLDPIIFSVDAEIDISNPEHDEEIARIGLCFGTDMPIDFFVERGLQIVNDKRFKAVTHVLRF